MASALYHLCSLFLSFLAGIFMLLVGIYIMRLAATLQWLEKLGKTLIWQHLIKLNKYLMPIDSPFKALGYGALWGWLPCGLVYSALTWAMTSGNAINGALVMLAFALGLLADTIVSSPSYSHKPSSISE